MKKKIPFVKMHGLGNDFVIIPQDNMHEIFDIKNFAKNICNRELGVGCDQFIIYDDNSYSVFSKVSKFFR